MGMERWGHQSLLLTQVLNYVPPKMKQAGVGHKPSPVFDDHLSVHRIAPADQAANPRVERNGSPRVRPPIFVADRIPLLFGLAPGGVCHASPVTRRAVSSYLAFSPLPA